MATMLRSRIRAIGNSVASTRFIEMPPLQQFELLPSGYVFPVTRSLTQPSLARLPQRRGHRQHQLRRLEKEPTPRAFLLLLADSALLPYGDDRQEQIIGLTWPGSHVLFLAAMAFIMMLAEGSMLDWSAVPRRQGRNDPKECGHRLHGLLDCDDNEPAWWALDHSETRTQMDYISGCASLEFCTFSPSICSVD
jgi:hypothetical protein